MTFSSHSHGDYCSKLPGKTSFIPDFPRTTAQNSLKKWLSPYKSMKLLFITPWENEFYPRFLEDYCSKLPGKTTFSCSLGWYWEFLAGYLGGIPRPGVPDFAF
jgi:hypothetical protein